MMCGSLYALELILLASAFVSCDSNTGASDANITKSMNVVTEISVKETVNGQTIQRKPTSDEIRLIEKKFLGTSYNDSNKKPKLDPPITRNNEELVFNNDEESTLANDIVDLESFIPLDSEVMEDDPFDKYLEENDDVDDMSSILNKGDEILFNNNEKSDKTQYSSNKKTDKIKDLETDMFGGDYRKIFHSQKENFSNIKTVKITISETEGDFLEDEVRKTSSVARAQPEHDIFEGSGDSDTTVESITEIQSSTIDNRKYEQLIDFLENNVTNEDVDDNKVTQQAVSIVVSTRTSTTSISVENSDNSTAQNTLQETSFTTEPGSKMDIFTEQSETTTYSQNVNAQKTPTTTDSSNKINDVTTEQNPSTTSTEHFSAPPESDDNIADNGISLKDFSEITSILSRENHEIRFEDDDIKIVEVDTTTKLNAITKKPAENFIVITEKENNVELGEDTTLANTNMEKLSIDTSTFTIEFDKTKQKIESTTVINTSSSSEEFTTESTSTEEFETMTSSTLTDFKFKTNQTIKHVNISLVNSGSVTNINTIQTDGTILSDSGENVNSSNKTTKESTEPTSTQVNEFNPITSSALIEFNSETEETLNETIERMKINLINSGPVSNDDIIEVDDTMAGDSKENSNNFNKIDILRGVNKNEQILLSRELTPSEVESMYNRKIEEFESVEDNDDSLEERKAVKGLKLQKVNPWEIFKNMDESSKITKTNTDDNHIEESKNEESEPKKLSYDEITTTMKNIVVESAVPILDAPLLNASSKVSIKISRQHYSMYIPSSALVREYSDIVNVTWRLENHLNNSIAFRIHETEDLYVITEFILNILLDNYFIVQKKHIRVAPNSEDSTSKPMIIKLKDGVHVTFSNLEFLRKPLNGGFSESATRARRVWNIEVASICLVVIAIVIVSLYVIILKRKSRVSLREKADIPQITHC